MDIDAHLGLASSHARRFVGARRQDFDDARSEAYLALIRAGRTFDPERGVPFAAYASQAIQHHLLEYRRTRMRADGWRRVRANGCEWRHTATTVPLNAAADLTAPSPEAAWIDRLARLDVARLAQGLTTRERQTVRLALAGLSQWATARRLGIGQVRVGQLRQAAVRKLRQAIA